MSRVKQFALVAVVAVVVALGPSSIRLGGQTATAPILVVLNNTTQAPFGNYLPEILRAEGINSFDTAQLSAVTAVNIAPYRLIVLAETALTATQAGVFSSYVTNGGRLIAMRPDSDLYATLGIAGTAGTSTNRPTSGFLSATISQTGPGAGLQSMSLPFRGAATHYTLSTATPVATMSGGAAGGFPAVVQSGRTAAWAFDLARSVAYVRQGDPLDVNQDRDGQPVYRTNDIFYQRIDLNRVNTPHADVHMRLFARMIETLLADSTPLPRLWYFPGVTRTMVIPTGDSHTSTLAPYTALLNSAQSYGARVSIYLPRWTSVPSSTVNGWRTAGHEVGLHPYFDPDNLENDMAGGYTVAVNWWNSIYGFPYSPTERHHSLEWTGWADPAAVMQSRGIRMDTSYYAWGPALNNPTQQSQAHGYINGSGQPMRFINESGSVYPVYQQVTALTDEQLITGSYAEGLTVPQALAVSRQLIDESQAGSYAAIMTQFHVDYYQYSEVGPWVDGTMAYAQSLSIPMWTSQRWLQFVEARHGAAMTNVAWSAANKTLTFTVDLVAGAENHTVLVPATFGSDAVNAVAINGSSVSTQALTVNGRAMRAITIVAGAARNVAVLYAVPTPAIAIGDITVTEGHAGTTVAALPLTLSSPSSTSVSVQFQTANGTATQPGDYQTGSGTITFSPFQTSQLVPVTIVGDLAVEANETFSVTLSNPSNATIEDGVGIVTISDDDAPPTITITDASVTEGNSGTTPASFTVSLSHASGSTVSVQYATASGTATSGTDFTAGSGTLTFNPGVTQLPIAVPVVGDTAAEPNETFAVNLTAPVNGTLGDNQGIGTIVNDDSGTITTTATFQVQSGNDDVNEESGGFTADSSTVWAGSGATAATSYTGLRFTGVTIPPGAVVTSARLELRSANAQWLTIGFQYGIDAAANSAAFTTGNRPSQRTLLPQTATHSSDQQWLASTWYQLDEIAPLVQAAVNQPGWASGNALSLVLRGTGSNWARKFATAFEGGAAFAPRLVVTYSYAEASQPSLSIGDVTVAEGNSGTTAATFSVSLSAPTPQVVTANWATANGTATAGSDYTAGSGTVTFPANSTTPQTITVQVNGDTANEPNETFVVNLTAPVNATISDGEGTGTITNDDAAQPSVSIADASLVEGNAGTSVMNFTVTLSATSAQAVTVTAATSAGTATAGSDYVELAPTVVTIPAGSTTQTVPVTINGDTLNEGNETFTVTLSAPGNATLGDATALGTITNDDGQPALTITDVTLTEGAAANAVFTVTLAPASGQPVTVNYATANGTATAGTDFTTTSGTLTFTAGATTQTITVPVANDALDEADETFLVNLSGAVNASIGDSQGQGTIVNDDAEPSLSITSPTTAEGNAGTTPLTFTVTLSAASGQQVTVSYASAGVTAASGADFAAASGTLTFAPGDTSQTVTVQVNGDLLDEANETLTVTLTSPTNAALGTAVGTGTITDDDATPTLSINDLSLNEGNAGTSPATFTVTLSAASGQTVTVNYAAADLTTDGDDFVPASGTLTFTPGVTTQQVTVNVTGDTAAEADETFAVNLSSAANATITDGTGQGTIVNDDGVPSITIGDASAAEGAGTVSFTVTLSEPPAQTVTVNYATASGVATAPADFTAASGTLTFTPAGPTTQNVVVTIAQDTLSEAAETFAVNLSAPVNATIADGQAVGTITDDDPLPVLSVSDAVATEGNSGTANLVFTVSLAPVSGQSVTVNYATANGTATAGSDYTASSGSLTFAAGETAKTVTVLVAGDTAVEPNEGLSLLLSTPGNATIGDDTGVGTITNDDLPVVSIAPPPAAITEGNAGTTPATFTVSLSAAAGSTVTVNYTTVAGSAAAGTDFTATSGTLTFLAGETSKTVPVDVLGDVTLETNETFSVTLSGPTGATLGTASATATIANDDAGPTISIGDVTVTEGTGSAVNAVFTVTLSQASALTTTVGYTVAGVTAVAGTDFTAVAPGTLTFTPGVTTQQLTVSVLGDSLDEGDETFTVTLTSPTNATILDGSGVGTIVDNDAPPTIGVGNATVTEGNSGTVNAVFTVSLSSASGLPVSATVNTANGTATAGSDYTAIVGGTVTVPAGSTTATVTVPVAGDVTVEASETFTVTLSSPGNATLGTATGTGTITNDDQPTMAINDVAVAEGNSGTTAATFTVTLSQAHVVPVTVTYATANGTATAGSDYTAIAATVLTFPAGTTSLPVTVTVLGDTTTEPNETFVVNLTAPGNATIADAQGVGTITNDDAGPVVVTVTLPISAGGDDVNENGTTLTTNASDGWIGNANASTTSYAGFRFVNVPIPANATITAARLETQAASTQWQRMAFQMGIEAVANSAAFSATALPSARVLLGPKVNHSSDTQWLANTWYSLEDITAIVQAAIAQPGWQSGNAMSLILRGTGQPWGRKFVRNFEAGAAVAPRLVVTYQVAP